MPVHRTQKNSNSYKTGRERVTSRGVEKSWLQSTWKPDEDRISGRK
jgi:hypothetical protein